jgi:hypothetical protein
VTYGSSTGSGVQLLLESLDFCAALLGTFSGLLELVGKLIAL